MITPTESAANDAVPLKDEQPATPVAAAAMDDPSGGLAFWKSQNLSWIADRNPFYLLSAACLILGCWLLGRTSQSLPGLSAMIIGLVAYEVLAVPLALWLAKQRHFGRDAAILAVLVVFLASDFTFFYSQAATENQAFAHAVSWLGAAQSLAVVGWLLRGFKVRLSLAGQWILAADFLAIHLMPLAMRLLSGHANMALALLSVAVLAGGLMALHGLPARWRHAEMAAASSRLTLVLAWLTPAIALLSLLAHGTSVQWVYEIRFGAVHLAPLVMGGATLLLGLERKRLWPNQLALKWAGALALVAVMLTWGDDLGLTWNTHQDRTWFGVSPMRGVCLAAALVFGCAWRMSRLKIMLFSASCALGIFLLGHSMKAAAGHVGDLWGWIARASSGIVPTSRAGWGALLFVGAFVMLGAGALISRHGARKRVPVPATQDEREADHA